MQFLFPKEEEIMYAIWNIGRPCLISDILNFDSSLKRNTVAKVLLILEKKGYIKVDSITKTATRCGKAYVPIFSETVYSNQKKLFSIVEKSCNPQNGILSFVSTLTESGNIDENFIEEMNRLIDNYRIRQE